MDFIDDRSGKAAAKGRQDAVAKAREAREARRLAQEQRGTVEQAAAREKAVLKLQPTLRRHLTFLNSRTLQRNEWDVALAAAGPSPPAGQQLALCGWLLRFFQPTKDDERLRAFCGVLVACMEQEQHPLMFVSLALNRHLALWWSNTTRCLLLTLCQLLSPGAAVLSDLLKADPSLSASANAAAAKKRLNSHFGPLLRVLLLLCEPDKWKLGAQLNAAGGAGEQAARALGLMGQSVVLAAAESLASAAGTLALGVHTVADASLLGAAVAVASFPLQSASTAPPPEALKALLLGGLLRVPALTTRVGTAAARLGKGSLIFSRLTELGPSLAADVAASAEVLGADGALCVAGNLLSLLPTQPPPSAAQVLGMARLVGALLALQPQASSATPRASSSSSGGSGGGNSYFHPLRGWTSKVAGAAISEHLDAVAAQLSALWSAKMLPLLYSDALAVPLGTRPVDGALRALDADQLQSLAARACAGAQLHAAALKALPPRRAPGLARLAYSTHLVPALWALLRLLDERKAVPFSRLVDDLIHDPTQSPHAPLLVLLLEAGTALLTVIDDKEVHEDRAPFAPDELCELVRLLNRLAFRLHWELADDASPLVASTSGVAAHSTGASAMRRTLRELATQMLSLLAERDARRPFCPPEMWLVPELRYSELHRELNEGKPRAKRLLGNVPWVVPFERRVNIFRELVAKEKETLPNEQLQEHLKGYRIKIRREHLLEDGYVQMGGLGAEQLKGTIRVEFVNSLGLSEAGIDRTGVFKEFMEDTAATAFDPNRGLFRLTKANLLYPSPSSAQADPYHLRYFEFVGRMLGKAIYEGIVLDVPLADFFVLKLLHKSATLDELPSLDGELASSLDFLKRYEGDVESDLCLTFSMDTEEFGQRTTVDLRDAGSTIAVTKENRIEYVHAVADYRLNEEIKEQCKAVLTGMHAVVPHGWLRLFNRPELQRLVGGDDVIIDVDDLRKHTKYAGGYNDFSPTIRDLWSVLKEFERKDRALFLKFVTSCSKPPLLGFAHLHPTFTIQCVSADGDEMPSVLAFFGMGRKETGRLPTAATCFNLLKLPNFKSRKVLKEKLLYAIKSESGFDLS